MLGKSREYFYVRGVESWVNLLVRSGVMRSIFELKCEITERISVWVEV